MYGGDAAVSTVTAVLGLSQETIFFSQSKREG